MCIKIHYGHIHNYTCTRSLLSNITMLKVQTLNDNYSTYKCNKNELIIVNYVHVGLHVRKNMVERFLQNLLKFHR